MFKVIKQMVLLRTDHLLEKVIFRVSICEIVCEFELFILKCHFRCNFWSANMDFVDIEPNI